MARGAFRRFKDVLLAYPAERERWFTYRADLLHWHIHNWLIEREIEPTLPPPWGEAKPPPELAEATLMPIPHGTEAPGEALRRNAREIIDALPALELPSAIAFLEFLAARGTPPGDVRAEARRPVAKVSHVDDDEDNDGEESEGDDDDDLGPPHPSIRHPQIALGK